MDCRDCKYYFEDEDRRKCMNKNRTHIDYYGDGCKYFNDGSRKETENETGVR